MNSTSLFNLTYQPNHSFDHGNLTFCINYFDTGTYYCPECASGVPESILLFARIEFALALLVIAFNVLEILLIWHLLIKSKRENLRCEKQLTKCSPFSSLAAGGDALTLCTFAVCDCLLGEGYLLEISCALFTGSASRPVCKWADRTGVFLIKFGGIYMPTALLNEACIKRIFVYFKPTRAYSCSTGQRVYASPRFVAISWCVCLFVCFLDTVIQALDEKAYDVYYSTIKYCLLGADGIFYLTASLFFVVQANRRRRRRRRHKRSARSIIFESRARCRQRWVWNANFGVQFFIFFICIAIFLSVNVFWFTQELTQPLDATNQVDCLGLLIVYKLVGLTFGLGKPFIFFLGLTTITRSDDDGSTSTGTSLRTISDGSIASRTHVQTQSDIECLHPV